MNQVSKTTLFTAIALAVSLSTPSAFAKTTVKRVKTITVKTTTSKATHTPATSTSTVTTTTPTTTLIEQSPNGAVTTTRVGPEGISMVNGMPFYPTTTVITPVYRTTPTSVPTVVTPVSTPAGVIPTGASTTVVSTAKVDTNTPVTVTSPTGNSVTIDKPATVISTTTTTPVLIPANPNVATPVAVTPVPVVPTVPTVVVTP